MPPDAALDLRYEQLKDRSVDDAEYQARRKAWLAGGVTVEDYLLGRLEGETDPVLQGDVLQILGRLRFHGGRRLPETAAWARRLIHSDVASVRCRALWVLGWVGGADDLAVLTQALDGDDNPENRGWAATAMMQLFLSDETTQAVWLGPLKQALHREKDEGALEKVLISLQEISGTKLGLKASTHAPAPKAKLDAALKKALKL